MMQWNFMPMTLKQYCVNWKSITGYFNRTHQRFPNTEHLYRSTAQSATALTSGNAPLLPISPQDCQQWKELTMKTINKGFNELGSVSKTGMERTWKMCQIRIRIKKNLDIGDYLQRGWDISMIIFVKVRYMAMTKEYSE